MAVHEWGRDPGDENPQGDGPVDLSLLADGQALRIQTRNSTYTIRKQAGGLTWRIEQVSAKSGGYVLTPNPLVAEIATNYLRPGVSLMFARKSPREGFDVRLTSTSRIVSIEELR